MTGVLITRGHVGTNSTERKEHMKVEAKVGVTLLQTCTSLLQRDDRMSRKPPKARERHAVDSSSQSSGRANPANTLNSQTVRQYLSVV